MLNLNRNLGELLNEIVIFGIALFFPIAVVLALAGL
jgi:hypothetical protein